MISYELAKELKDKGFPFKRINVGDLFDRNGHYDFNPEGDTTIGAQHFYPITLEELIEACGDGFGSLHAPSRFNEEWIATKHVASGKPLGAKAGSPIEAVALLWLSLNKKSND